MTALDQAAGLNVGCGPHYAAGWYNTDLIAVPGTIDPDLVVTPERPFPFPPATFARAYCGHVLEHVPWADVPAWLDALAHVLTPDAEAAFVGPDAHRVLDRWKNGHEEWEKVAGIIEGVGAYRAYWEATVPQFAGGYLWAGWDGDRHHWNCYEARVVDALVECGWRDVTAWPLAESDRLPEDALRGAGWPLVDGSPCQFAVTARRPA